MRRSVSTTAVGLAVTVVLEVVVFVLVANAIGLGYALLILLATSIFGGWLLKHEGTRAWQRFRGIRDAGGRPGPELTRAVVGLGSAVLLIVPGFVTDLVGLVLLVPPMRSVTARGTSTLAARRLSGSVADDLFGPRRVRVKAGRPGGNAPAPEPGEPLEGEIVDPRP
jgi:UPF0716 protein FxsA